MKLHSRVVLLLLLFGAACGEFGPTPPPGQHLVVIWNQSQFELLQLKVHARPDHRDAPSLLEAPMPTGTETSTVVGGALYFTAVRERARGARAIALTTAEPLEIAGASWFELIVFDESFRLLPR